MGRCRFGNPKKRSEFLCLKCMRKDGTMNGIQRVHGQREKLHVKDMYCCHCKEDVKALEIRYNDYMSDDFMYTALRLHREYYNKDVEGSTKCDEWINSQECRV